MVVVEAPASAPALPLNKPVAGAVLAALLKKLNPPPAPVPAAPEVAVALPNMPVPVDAGCVVVVLPNIPGAAADVPGVDEAPPRLENIVGLERASVVELDSNMLLRFPPASGSAVDGTDVSRFRLPKRLLLPVPVVEVPPAPGFAEKKDIARNADLLWQLLLMH